MAEAQPSKHSGQRQIPRAQSAVDDLIDEGRGVIISGDTAGNGPLDISIGQETVSVDRKTFVKIVAAYANFTN